MCGVCGCDGVERHHHHDHEIKQQQLDLQQAVLSDNQQDAKRNQDWLQQHRVLALNLVSSPGAGKTTLLTAILPQLLQQTAIWVIEGDQQTDRDAQRIAQTGVPVLQINTGKVCHLDAHAISHAISELTINGEGILFIENVGNLVCPAMFDLGEDFRIVLLSVTEGDDKPLKYPDIFHSADLMLINKIDLLPYVDFSPEKCIDYARRVNANIDVLSIAAATGDGLADFNTWMLQKLQQKMAASRNYDR
jgi:hydrogenase nickel incorporation protein HypB